MPPVFDRLLATLRTAAYQRMAERRQCREQHAAAATAPHALTVAKAQEPVAAVVEPQPTDAVVKALIAEVAEKALAAKALIPQSPPVPAEVSAADRRAQLRAQHQRVVADAIEACRAGRISVTEVARLQAVRLRLDEELEG